MNNKIISKCIKDTQDAQMIHIVIGDIGDCKAGSVLFENVKVAHSIDAPSGAKTFDELKAVIIEELESWINEI